MSKFKSKYSPMKVVGIIFLVVTLIVAVSLTNNTVRQVISSSFAYGSWRDIGDPNGGRHAGKIKEENENRAQNEAFRLQDCIVDPECMKTQVAGIRQAGGIYEWYKINLNNYKCANNMAGCVR